MNLVPYTCKCTNSKIYNQNESTHYFLHRIYDYKMNVIMFVSTTCITYNIITVGYFLEPTLMHTSI